MWKDLPYKGCVYFSLILNALSLIFILISRGFLPPVVPLFYGLPSGADQLTPGLGLVVAPVTGIAMTFINIFVGDLTRDIFLKKTLIISSAFVALLLSIAVIKIVLLVGFF